MARTKILPALVDPESPSGESQPLPVTHQADSLIQPSPPRDSEGLLLGRVVGFLNSQPIVAYELGGTLYQSTVYVSVSSVHADDMGATVCLALAEGDLSRPILIGKICNAAPATEATDKLVITHPHEIALRCGQSTVQLKSDGTIAIRGTNVASRATQTNRIRGANVQIN